MAAQLPFSCVKNSLGGKVSLPSGAAHTNRSPRSSAPANCNASFSRTRPMTDSKTRSETAPARGYEVVDFAQLPGVPCPCGTARRGLADVPDFPGTIHVTEIAADAHVHTVAGGEGGLVGPRLTGTQLHLSFEVSISILQLG